MKVAKMLVKYLQGPKSDVFSLGMVLLEMATLYKSEDCYDFSTWKIKVFLKLLR